MLIFQYELIVNHRPNLRWHLTWTTPTLHSFGTGQCSANINSYVQYWRKLSQMKTNNLAKFLTIFKKNVWHKCYIIFGPILLVQNFKPNLEVDLKMNIGPKIMNIFAQNSLQCWIWQISMQFLGQFDTLDPYFLLNFPSKFWKIILTTFLFSKHKDWFAVFHVDRLQWQY